MNAPRNWVSSVAVATALCGVAFSSGAEELSADGRSLAVKVWDLDLAQSADVEQLYQRLLAAANEVCRDEVRQHRRQTRTLPATNWTENCVQRAVDDAVREAGNRRLAALHQSAPRG